MSVNKTEFTVCCIFMSIYTVPAECLTALKHPSGFLVLEIVEKIASAAQHEHRSDSIEWYIYI